MNVFTRIFISKDGQLMICAVAETSTGKKICPVQLNEGATVLEIKTLIKDAEDCVIAEVLDK